MTTSSNSPSKSAFGAVQTQPLRIVTVTHFYPAHGGGLELVAGRLVEEFAARGAEITWFSSNTDLPPNTSSSLIRCEPVPTSNIVERTTQLPYPLWSPLALPRLWNAIGSADVVHVHEHLYACSIISILMARLRKRPVVVTQHMGALGLPNPALTKLYEWGARLLGHLLFPLTSRSVFISANVRKFFNRNNNPGSLLIYNGVDVGRFNSASGTAARSRVELGLPESGPIVVFVGRLVRKKGLGTISRMAKQLPSIHWVIIGSGPENPTDWNLPNVQAIGRKSHDALPDYLRSAELLILPSTGEGFPLVVQEAICCGTGVLSTEEVATACPPVSSLIRSCPTPRGEPDINQWTESVRTALADSSYIQARQERSDTGRALWSWRHCADQYFTVFSDLAVESRASQPRRVTER